MRQPIAACVRASCAASLLILATTAHARAIPVFANGQGVSCQSCHTTYPGMTTYGMMTMMGNFQNLDWRKQHQALPISLRLQIESFLSNGSYAGDTTVKTLSLLSGGFLGRNFTYYAEQPFVDTGSPGITEQLWIAWNGLFRGANSLQLGKYHTPFPFMPAHGWTIGNYLLATQDSGQNTFEPNDSHWGPSFNGMSNEFMYNVAYLAGNQSVQHAFDYSRADSPRTLDLNLSYGGMTKPYTIGLVGMRGTTPLRNDMSQYVTDDTFTREGLYYSYQNLRYFVQTMYYHGSDSRPNPGIGATPFNGFMLEVERDFGWRNHVLVRYDVAASDTLNRHYVASFAHQFLPNTKITAELIMVPGTGPQFGLAFDWAGPFQANSRYVWKAPLGAALVSDGRAARSLQVAAQPAPSAGAGTPPPATSPAPSGDPNAGAKLVQSSGCVGCHGATFQGGLGPALYGIEHRLGSAQIAESIKQPRPPMPDLGFTDAQIGDIVAYLSNLDGGIASTAPVVTLDPATPTDRATLTVRFPGTPQHVTAKPTMQMGRGSMHTDEVTLHPTSDPHVWQGQVQFSMSGPWTIELLYDGKLIEVPVNVAGAS
jgi:mono/diheme cytochrome c family protein